MGTDAGIRFKASQETVYAMKFKLSDLDAIVNETGLGVSCTPYIYEGYDGYYHLVGQTHWKYENGVALLREIRKWVGDNNFDIKIEYAWRI